MRYVTTENLQRQHITTAFRFETVGEWFGTYWQNLVPSWVDTDVSGFTRLKKFTGAESETGISIYYRIWPNALVLRLLTSTQRQTATLLRCAPGLQMFQLQSFPFFIDATATMAVLIVSGGNVGVLDGKKAQLGQEWKRDEKWLEELLAKRQAWWK